MRKDKSKSELLLKIFEDADVVDVDWSHWWRSLRLCVVADHIEAPVEGRRAVFLVSFKLVSTFVCEFQHLDVVGHSYFNWLTNGAQLDTSSGEILVIVRGLGSSPLLNIQCKDISIDPLSVLDLDRLYPGWGSPKR